MPGFTLTEENVGSVAKVCRALEGIPLALELAAARVGAMSVERISERLADSQGFLSGSRTAPPRQQSLEGALDWSFGLLSKRERELFGRLSVFVGGWALEAAEAVGAGGSIGKGEVLELLMGLVDKSLVVAESDGKDSLRYRMLEPIQQYGQKRLEESREPERVRGRHAEYYLALAEEAEPKLVGAEQGMWLDLLEAEVDNLRAAIGWSAEAGEPEMGLRFAGALLRFCYLRGRYREGREWFEGVLSRGGASPAPLRAKALYGVGYLLFLQCEYDSGKALLQQSAALYRELKDKRGLASALRGLASVEREQGRYARARTLHEDSITLWRELGDEAGIADTLAYLAMAAWLEGDHGRAEALGNEALVMCRRLGDTHGTICSLIVLGAEANHEGDYERAEEILQEGLLLSREGLREGVPFSLHQMGIAAHRRGEQDRARALLEESLVLHRDVGDRWRMASVLEGLAEVSSSLGDHERASRLFGAAEVLRQEIRAPLPSCERADYEQGVAAARAGLEEGDFDAAWSEGRAMTPDQAVEYALSSTQPQSTNQEQPLADRKPEEALTPRERQIAELVARGLTNRQIAEELVISEHTAATHVRRILKKLNFRSRTQITTWVGKPLP